MNKPLKVFITYSRKDREAKHRLIRSLAVMKRQGLIEIWHDEKILGGDRWQEEIFSIHVPTSDLLLYLVSAESLASENCYKELEIALKKGIRVIPIIFADCDWKNDQLRDFQGFPDNGLPITKWNNESEGWQNVVDGIRKTISKLESQANPSFGGAEKDLQAELAFERGNIRLLREELDEAIEAYSQSIDLMPQVASSYNNRGVVYWRKGDFDLAITDFDKVIELDSDDAKACTNRGVVYSSKGDHDEAIVDLTKAIELKPNYAEAYHNRGNTYKAIGDIDRATQDYNTAIELTPNAFSYTNRGTIYGMKGEYDFAIKDFGMAIELQPDYANAYYNRGLAYFNRGEVNLAIADYTKTIELTPDSAEVYYNRGLAYSKKGEVELAIKDYTKAIELKPDYADAYYSRGGAFLRLGEREKAEADLATARNMGADAITALDKILQDHDRAWKVLGNS